MDMHQREAVSSPIAQGERIRHHSAGPFTVVDATYLTARKLSNHAHDDALVTFAPSGPYAETIDGARHVCRRGEYLLKPAGAVHANRFDLPRTRCVSIAIPVNVADTFPPLRKLLQAPRCVRGEAGVLQSAILAELRRRDELGPLALQGIVFEVLAALARIRDDVGSESFRRARDFVHACEHRAPRLEEIAAAAGVHSAHLNRLFRRHAGVSTAEYVRRLRAERAARDLSDSDLTIADVAARHGFYDQSHLTNSFRRYLGRSPGAYRRGVRKA